MTSIHFHTTGRLAGRPTGLHKIKSPNWSKVGMLYAKEVIEVDKVDICCSRKIRQIREG